MNPLTVPAPGAVHVTLGVAVAKIRVAECPGEVRLGITGQKNPDDVSVESTTDADGTVRLKVSERRRLVVSLRRRQGVVIDLATPPGTALVVDGAAADLRSTGTLGQVHISTAAGDTHLDHVTGDVHVKGGTGDVQVASVGGELSVHLISGDVTAGDVAAGAQVRTASGQVAVGAVRGVSAVNSVSGDVRVASAGAGSLSVQVLSGDVSIGIAPGVSSALDVSTLSGRTTSDLPVTGAPSQSDSPSLDLTVSTVSGDVRIHPATKEAA
jgi:Putative adhesin